MTDEQKFICLDGSHPRNAITSMKVWPFPFTEHDADYCWCSEHVHLPAAAPQFMRVTWVEFLSGYPLCILHGKVGRQDATTTYTTEIGLEVQRKLNAGAKSVRCELSAWSWVDPT